MLPPNPDSPSWRVIDPDSPEWPHTVLAALHSHPDPDVEAPDRLWVRGEASLADLTARSATIEGANAASSYGEHLAAEFGYDLARAGVTTVSGGGYGCSAAALRGARAADGPVVVVLPSGIAVDHPAAHTELFRRIAATCGLIISPHPPHTPPSSTGVARRAALMAALTRGVVIVEAGVRSGTSHLARRARELGRPVMALPGPVTSAASAGCHHLIRAGHATLVTTPAHVVALTGLSDPESTEANGAENTSDADGECIALQH
jgi:DNA processing protein